MPAAIPFIIVAIGAIIQGASIYVIVAALVVEFALVKLQELFVRKPSAGPPPPLNATVSSTVEYRRLVLGRIRCGGAVLFYRCSGNTNDLLWFVVAYAGHQCDGVEDAFIDARQIPSADINASTGAVATAAFNGKIRIWTYLGTEAQTVDAHLATAFATLWTTNHKLQGVCYRVFQLTRDDTAWPSGAPQNFNSITRGVLAYDPRKDSTNGGSGTHRTADATTWEYTENPALLVRWFLTGGTIANDNATRKAIFGLRETDARMEDPYTIAAANHSDESLSGANAPPSGAQTRYAVGIECSCGQTRRDILTELLATMGPGQLSYVHGKWRIYAGAYDSPIHAFTQDDLYGNMEIQDTTSATDRFNQCCATYIDAAQQWGAATTIFRTNAAYTTQDNGEDLQKTIPVRGATNAYRAQRIAEIVLRSSRLMRTVKFRFRRNGMKVATWETFTMSHRRYGWTNRVFRCMERQLEIAQDGGVVVAITGKFEDSGVYTDMLTADYFTGTSVTSAIQNDVPDQPLSLTATALGGQNIRFDWTLGSFWLQNGISEIWEAAAGQPFANASLIWQGRATTVVITRGDTITRAYWVRVRTVGGQVSAEYPTGTGVAGVADTVDTGDITANAATAVFTTFNGSTGNITVPASTSDDLTYTALTLIINPAPAVDCTVIVTVTGRANVTTGSPGDASIGAFYLATGTGASQFSSVPMLMSVNSVAQNALITQWTFSHSHATPIAEIGLQFNNSSAGSRTVTYDSLIMHVEFIKR